MQRYLSVVIAIIMVLFGACEDRSSGESPPGSSVESEGSAIPETFSAALDALDEMATEADKNAYRNDEVDLGLVQRQVGMRLRNDWGLWSESKLKDYFSERGIAHADWISSAIFEAWIERLKTGTVDEEAVIAKYAKIEKEWRKGADKLEKEWREESEKPEPSVPSEDDPFAPLSLEESNGGQSRGRR